MNWLEKIAQSPLGMSNLQPSSAQANDIIMGVIENRYDGSGPSVSQPEGGWAYQQFKQLGPLPEVCKAINDAASLNISAPPKMQILAEAAGCPWEPKQPQNNEQPQQSEMNAVMPQMGQQEQPMDTPSVEIG